MNEIGQDDQERTRESVSRIVGEKEARKLHGRRSEQRTVWFGLGAFGLVGWAVVIPTLLCVALGIWIDSHWPSRFSWTLMLLFVGIVLGSLNAWYWLAKEGALIEQEQKE